MARKDDGHNCPAARRLRQLKVPHEVVAFGEDVRSGKAAAERTGTNAASVLKTLVVEEDPPSGKPWLVLVPASARLDLKAFAMATGARKARMATQEDAERATGMEVGAISAIPLAGRGFRVVIDSLAAMQDVVLVSGGQRGYDVRVGMRNLQDALDAQVLSVTREDGPD